MRIGVGYDSHRFVQGRRLVVGGEVLESGRGLLGHSDGDVLTHAIIDSIIGALGTGDIGGYFPDTDPRWKDASSLEMLRHILNIVIMNDYEVSWIDSTVIAEEPRLSPYILRMISNLNRAGLPEGSLNIKAKTNEGMGFIGRGEGIAAVAVCLLIRRR